MIEFSIDSQQYSVTRPKLWKWLSIENLRNKIIESAGKSDEFATGLFAYLSALLDIDDSTLENAPWYEVLSGYYLAVIECYPSLDLSILLSGGKKEGKLPDPWEYDGRVKYGWVHMFAKNYGWSLEYVSELDVDDAFALIQEISLEDQFEKEWQWGMSEVAYEYDPTSKKSNLKKLPRPDWMMIGNRHYQKKVDKEKKPSFKVRTDFLPHGVIIYDGKQEHQAFDAEGNSNTT